MKGYVRTLVACSILAALGFVLDRFLGVTIPLFGAKTLMINLSYVPIFYAGIMYGPVWGALVGGVQDLLCVLLVPMGAFIPGLTLTTMLAGFLAGIFGRFVLKINAGNRGELISNEGVYTKRGNAVLYVTAAVSSVIFCVTLFLPAVSFALVENTYELSVWQLLTEPEIYKSAFIAILSSLGDISAAQMTYAGLKISDTAAVISVSAVMAFLLVAFSGILYHGKKKLTATLFSVFGFIFSGLSSATLLLYVPKSLKDTGITASFGTFVYIAPLIGAVVMLLVLVNTDAIKFKIAAFCAVTAAFTSILNSYWISLTYTSVTFWVYLLPRLASALLLSTPIYVVILYYLLVKAKWRKSII